MNKELKEQAHKEFDEFSVCRPWELEGEGFGEKVKFYVDASPEELKSFIDSLIDRTVQMTEERVVLSIKNLDNETIPRQEVLVCTHTDSMDSMCSECILELNDDIYRKGYNCAVLKIQEKLKESLITNKSDINNDKE